MLRSFEFFKTGVLLLAFTRIVPLHPIETRRVRDLSDEHSSSFIQFPAGTASAAAEARSAATA
jgi:hypothetical protein